MKFLEDRGELGLVGIDSLEEVDISEIEFDDILLRSALNLIFQQTNDDTRSPEPLTYVIRDEVVVITTVAKADSDEMKATRVYDVGHLLRSNGNQNIALNGRSLADNADSRSVETLSNGAMRVSDTEEGLWSFPVDSSGHPSANPRPPALIRMIISTTINEDFDNWRYPYGQGMFGSAELFGSKLVVTQSPAMHLRIVRLLNLLSEPSTAQPQGR
jgi:hypothetical protein